MEEECMGIFNSFFGLFLFDMVIDFGMVNMLVYVKGCGVVLNEFFVVVVMNKGGCSCVLVVGNEVKMMLGWILVDIEVVCLMRDGVIVDFGIVEYMIKYFICKLYYFMMFVSLWIVVCVLLGVMEVEWWVIYDLVFYVGVWCV